MALLLRARTERNKQNEVSTENGMAVEIEIVKSNDLVCATHGYWDLRFEQAASVFANCHRNQLGYVQVIAKMSYLSQSE